MTTSHLNCIILKSNENDTTNSQQQAEKSDRYVDYLTSKCGARLSHISAFNPLKFEYVDLAALSVKLTGIFTTNSPLPRYRCLIVTSRQTVEAIERAIFSGEQSANDDDDTSSSIHIGCSLDDMNDSKVLVYCVGDATADRFKRLLHRVKRTQNEAVEARFIMRTSESRPSDQEHKQNAQQLARVIVDDYRYLQSKDVFVSSNESFYALYPCSNIRKHEMSKCLSEAGIKYDELVVYQTATNEESIESLKAELDSFIHSSSLTTCLVFFSPSGVNAVWSNPSLRDLITGDKCSRKFRFVSIGPSTTQKLKALLQTDEIYELSKPSPENLLAKLDEI